MCLEVVGIPKSAIGFQGLELSMITGTWHWAYRELVIGSLKQFIVHKECVPCIGGGVPSTYGYRQQINLKMLY